MVPVPSRCPRGVAQGSKFPTASPNYGSKSRTRRSMWVTHAARAAELGRLHTVQTGETLAQIALAYGVSVDQIQAVSKPGRRRRGSLRSDEFLQPGQKLIVNSETRQAPHSAVASTSGSATMAPQVTLPHMHTPWLAACLGGALLAAGAVRVVATTTTKPTAVVDPGTAATPPGPTAVEGDGPAPAPPGPAVASALFEVRALLQDAAVEMHAVESALAAVRRAAAASCASTLRTEQHQALAKEDSQPGAVGAAENLVAPAVLQTETLTTVADLTAQPTSPPTTAQAAAAAVDSSTAVSFLDIATDKVMATADAAAISTSTSSTSSSHPSPAATHTDMGTETLQPPTPDDSLAATNVPLSSVETVAVVGGTHSSVAAADGMSSLYSSSDTAAPMSPGEVPPAAVAAAVTETEVAAVPADLPAAAAATSLKPNPTWSFLSAFDTATQVAAARARVESALEAAYGIIRAAGPSSGSTAMVRGASPAASDSSDSEVEIVLLSAPPPPHAYLTVKVIEEAAPAVIAEAEAVPVVEAVAGVETADEVVVTAANEAEVVEVMAAATVVPEVEVEVEPSPLSAVEGPVVPTGVTAAAAAAEAVAAGSGVSGLPMDAVAAGQVLERIREINKLLEEQQRTESAVLSSTDDSATEVAADSVLLTASPPPPPSVPYSLPTADAVAAAADAAHVVVGPSAIVELPDEQDEPAVGELSASTSASASALILEPQSREVAAELAKPVQGAAEDQQEGQEQQPQEPPAALLSAGTADGGPPLPKVEVVVPPSLTVATEPIAEGAEGPSATTVPDPPTAAASSSPLAAPSPLSPPSPPAPPAPPVLSPGSRVTEALVGALTGSSMSEPGGIGEALLERIRDIGKLLDESHTDQQAAAAAAMSPTATHDLAPAPPRPLATRPAPPPSSPPSTAVHPAELRPPTLTPTADPPPPSPWDNETLPYPLSPPTIPQSTAPPPTATPVSDPPSDTRLLSLKTRLLDCVYGTARGVSASGAHRAAVDELVSALEAAAPHGSPTSALSCLGGSWKLLYTSAPGALMLLRALEGLPLVRVGDVVQTIHTDKMTATNKIELAVPVPVSLRAEAGLEVRSPRVFKVRFSRVGLDTYLATPTVTTALELPGRISLLGAEIDLGPVRQILLNPLTSGLEAAQGLLGRAVSPELDVESVPVPPGVSRGSLSEAASCWMLTTYLDDTLRISRDVEGRVYIMMKDVAMSSSRDVGSPQSPTPARSERGRNAWGR